MSTGFNGTPMPAFVDGLTPEQRWAITDFIVSLSGSDGPRYTNLVVAKPVRDQIDVSQGRRELRRRSRRPVSDHRADHGAGARVRAAGDVRDRAGDLRRRVDRPARALARPQRREDRAERPGAARAARGGGRVGARSRTVRGEPVRRRGGRAGGPAGRTRSVRRAARQPRRPPSSPTPSRSRCPRRCRPARASPTSSSATARARWISGSSIWPRPSPSGSPARAAPTSRRTTRAVSPVSPATTRASGRSSSRGRAVPPPGRPSRPARSCRSRSRSGTGSRASAGTGAGSRCGISLYLEPDNVPSPMGPMITTALVILGIELAIVGWVRRSRSRPREDPGGERTQQPAASV